MTVRVVDAASGEDLAGVKIARMDWSGADARFPRTRGSLQFLVEDGTSPVTLTSRNGADWELRCWIAAAGHAWRQALLKMAQDPGPEQRVELQPGGDASLTWPADAPRWLDPPEPLLASLALVRSLEPTGNASNVRHVPPFLCVIPMEDLEGPPTPTQDIERSLESALAAFREGRAYLGWTEEQVRYEQRRAWSNHGTRAWSLPMFGVDCFVDRPVDIDHLRAGRYAAVVQPPLASPWRGWLAHAEFEVVGGRTETVKLETIEPVPCRGSIVVPEPWKLEELPFVVGGEFDTRRMAVRSSVDPTRWAFDAGPVYPPGVEVYLPSLWMQAGVEVPAWGRTDAETLAPLCSTVVLRFVDERTGEPVRIDGVTYPIVTDYIRMFEDDLRARTDAAGVSWTLQVPTTDGGRIEIESEGFELAPSAHALEVGSEGGNQLRFPMNESSLDLAVRPARGARLHILFDGVEVGFDPRLFPDVTALRDGDRVESTLWIGKDGRAVLKLGDPGRCTISLFEGRAGECTVDVPAEGFVDARFAPDPFWRQFFR